MDELLEQALEPTTAQRHEPGAAREQRAATA